MDRRTFIATAGATGAGLQLPRIAAAQASDWPREPVRIVIPYSAGGPTEVAGRIIAQELTKNLGQNFLVDLRPGGSSVIGTDLVARAKPDGYTLLMQAAAFAINPSLIRKLPFDTVADFEPLTMATRSGLVLVTHAGSSINSVADVIAFARAKPGMAQFASAGNGSMAHMSMELFAAMAKIEAVHIPYKGSGAALPDVMGGHVPFMIDNLGSAMPHVRGGKLKAIAHTGTGRLGHGRLRDQQLVRFPGAGEDAGCPVRPHPWRTREGDPPPGHRRAFRPGWGGGGRQQPRRFRRLPQGRDGEVGQGRQGAQHQGGVTGRRS